MIERSTILIADDEPFICDMLQELLEPCGAQIQVAYSGKDAMAHIEAEAEDIDVAIVDIRMPPPDGLQILEQLQEQGSDLPVIMITGQDSSTLNIEAMQRGAYDYIRKPFNPDTIVMVIERAVKYRRLTQRVRTLEQQTSSKDPRDILIGQSVAMQEVYKLIGRVASSNATVLITGDSGTGKELVARVLHNSSVRSRKPFVTVNCAALPETLLESELFGHEKGAFTGAMSQRKGRFEQANHGTIFLDEIGEMSTGTQKKLLRVLQERTFNRVGGNTLVQVNVRIIAATNRDLENDVVAGTFREDLFYRLNVVNIPMPPLRERKEDIPLLVQYFLSQQPQTADAGALRITQEALEHLMSYDWPGNVRQLQNVIQRAAVLAHGHLIEADHTLLPDNGHSHDGIDEDFTHILTHLIDQEADLPGVMQRVYKQLTTLAIQQQQGNRAAAAHMLGIVEDQLDDIYTASIEGNALVGDTPHADGNGNGKQREPQHPANGNDQGETACFSDYLNLLLSRLNEPQRRWLVGVISYLPDGPSIRQLVRMTGLSSSTIMRGRREIAAGLPDTPMNRQRRVGGGRRSKNGSNGNGRNGHTNNHKAYRE